MLIHSLTQSRSLGAFVPSSYQHTEDTGVKKTKFLLSWSFQSSDGQKIKEWINISNVWSSDKSSGEKWSRIGRQEGWGGQKEAVLLTVGRKAAPRTCYLSVRPPSNLANTPSLAICSIRPARWPASKQTLLPEEDEKGKMSQRPKKNLCPSLSISC